MAFARAAWRFYAKRWVKAMAFMMFCPICLDMGDGPSTSVNEWGGICQKHSDNMSPNYVTAHVQ
ncbi:hypothetical protein C0Z19_05655 [Trinickia soli]|uniref:Uncharacterized protein n=1 Tax=Trinickia soli TaxID=380675 RepID=A0A2N7WCV3_9BURK|nr:hypothetical protein C0Z19_05655 [Trinickia soli]